MLQELRVAQTGVQLLTGFWLILPFQQRFIQLDGTIRTVYLITVAYPWQPLTPRRDVPWTQTSPSGRDRGGCDDQKISKYAQSWALVTGAAREQRLGYAFARQLAVEGLSLLLVDILDEDLNAPAKELRQQFGVDVRTATCDLGAHAPHKTIEEAVGGLDIDVLVCNHMFTPADTPPILDMPHTVG